MIRYLLRIWQRNKDREKRTAAPEVEDNYQANATTIGLTDMNDDCLEHIFQYLSLEALLNIADTNKQLKPAAELAFVRRFKRGTLILYKSGSEIRINETERVKVRNPYRLLRSFGHLIPNQKIHHHNKLKYVNQYCSESLIKIELDSLRRYMSKPFSKVGTVILHCRLNWNFNRLPKLFPNVHTFTFVSCRIEPRHIAVNFPHLRQVNIRDCSNEYGIESYVKMLRFNPQIRHLLLSPLVDHVKLLRAANQFVPFLEYLHLSYSENAYKNFEEKFVNFAHLKVLKISYYGELLTPIPVSSSCLEAFSFHLCSHATNCLNAGVDILLEFLKKHPFVFKFTLSSRLQYMVTTNRLEEIIEAVASMEEINISLIEDLSVNDAIKFVNKCKSLKRLSFRAANGSICDHLNTKLGVKWQVMAEKLDVSKILGMKKEERFGITIERRFT